MEIQTYIPEAERRIQQSDTQSQQINIGQGNTKEIVGPLVSEINYQPGGHQQLIEEAMIGEPVLLTPDSMQDPNRVAQIHPYWRDELVKGNELVIKNWGMTEIKAPETLPKSEAEKVIFAAD